MTPRNILVVLAVALCGLALGALWSPRSGAPADASMAKRDGGPCPDGSQPDYWVAPMDASFRRDAPGKSPMGMDLVPFCGGAASGADVSLSPGVRQSLGVRTEAVSRAPLSRGFSAAGHVRLDPQRVERIHSRAEGWIESLGVSGDGDFIAAGAPLYQLFSPKFYAAEAEFLATRQAPRLHQAARERLRALGYRDAQIQTLRERGQPSDTVAALARRAMTVTEVMVRPGQFVMPGTHLMTLARLDEVWVIAQLEASQIHDLNEGQAVTVSSPATPELRWETTIARLGTQLDPATRTLPLRLVLPNTAGRLLPGMFLSVEIQVSVERPGWHAPASSVIRDGRNDRVIKALGDGRFAVVPVTLGRRIGDRWQILKGVQEGDELVVQGQFLIDSEANVGAESGRITDADMAPEHEMSDPAMDDASTMTAAIVRGFNAEDGWITLDHEFIASIGMPPMTMSFDLATDIALHEIAVGDRVLIAVDSPAPGRYRITALEPER